MQRGAVKTWCVVLIACSAMGGLLWWAFVRDTGGGAAQTTLRFWNGFTGPDGRTMLRIIRRFNRDNPDVRVLMQRMDWNTYYNKLFVASLGGRAPEVFIIHTSNLPRFRRAGFLRDVDDLAAGPEPLDTADIDENIWRAVEFGGRHLAVPLDVHPQGLYYNETLLRRGGLVDASGRVTPPATGPQFVRAARQLTRDTDGDGRIDQWGFAFTHFPNNFQCLFPQFGGRLFTDDAGRCVLADPVNVDVLQMGADWIHKLHAAPPPEEMASWIGFRQGRVAMAFEGVYMMASLQKDPDLKFGAAPIPQFGPRRAAYADCHTLCMPRDLAGGKLKAAWRLIRFLSDHSLDWAEGGQVPVRKSLRNSPRFAALRVQSRYARQIPYLVFAPRVPFYIEFRTELGRALDRALRGRVSPRRALQDAADRIDRVIERDRRNFPPPSPAPREGGP